MKDKEAALKPKEAPDLVKAVEDRLGVLGDTVGIKAAPEKDEPKEVFCDACGRSLTRKGTTQALIGIRIGLYPSDSVDTAGYRKWAKNLFAPYDIDRAYNVCFACWLKALGVKPDSEK